VGVCAMGMPLTRARDNYTLRTDGIYFLMQEGPLEVMCRIDLLTLSQIGTTIGMSETTEIFETGRTTIERAASNKYDRTSRRPYEVVTVTADDLGFDDAKPRTAAPSRNAQ
jgi:Protein of unknown function (DUF1488)